MEGDPLPQRLREFEALEKIARKGDKRSAVRTRCWCAPSLCELSDAFRQAGRIFVRRPFF
jgi:hypothetical protein